MILSYLCKIKISSFAKLIGKGGRDGKGVYQNEQK